MNEPKSPRPLWQIGLLAVVLWIVLYFGLATIFPGVKTNHQNAALFFFLALTGLLAGRIAWIFR